MPQKNDVKELAAGDTATEATTKLNYNFERAFSRAFLVGWVTNNPDWDFDEDTPTPGNGDVLMQSISPRTPTAIEWPEIDLDCGISVSADHKEFSFPVYDDADPAEEDTSGFWQMLWNVAFDNSNGGAKFNKHIRVVTSEMWIGVWVPVGRVVEFYNPDAFDGAPTGEARWSILEARNDAIISPTSPFTLKYRCTVWHNASSAIYTKRVRLIAPLAMFGRYGMMQST